jgi:adenylate cyclase
MLAITYIDRFNDTKDENRYKELIEEVLEGNYGENLPEELIEKVQTQESGKLRYTSLLFFSGIFGLLMGIYREFLGFTFLKRWYLLPRLLAELFIIQILIMATILISNAVFGGVSRILTDPGWQEILFSEGAGRTYINVQIYGVILLFFMELEKSVGPDYFTDYLSGRYRSPKREFRTVMFLDLADSTSITESLGDARYYEFINHCFGLLTRPALLHGAEVLKYIGDEVILSWRDTANSDPERFLNFFRDFQSTLEANREVFIERYGRAPVFRAGVHHGKVVVAIIGDVKRKKDLSGDVMNTTSRIASKCKEFDTEMLISEDLYHRLKRGKTYFGNPQETSLRGKDKMHKVYKYLKD